MRQVSEEGEDRADVNPDEHALQHARGRVAGEEVREQPRDRRPASRPLVQPQRDPARVPEQQRDHDRRDHRQDQLRVALVAALEALWLDDPAHVEGRRHSDQHQHAEDVHQQRVPALRPQPRQGLAAVDDTDHRDQDRRCQDQEAPEDEGVHQPRPEALQELALAEHDRHLVARPDGVVTGAVSRLGGADECGQPRGAAACERPADHQRAGQRHNLIRRDYVPLTFRISAAIAGSTSCTSPITP